MPALAAITVNDGQATPVAHTFNPVGPDVNGVSSFVDRSGGIAIGFPRIDISLREPLKAKGAGSASDGKSRIFKGVITIGVPTLETTSPTTGTGIQPAPTIAYVVAARLEFYLPERSTLAERKNLLAYVKNALAHATCTSVLQDLESIY